MPVDVNGRNFGDKIQIIHMRLKSNHITIENFSGLVTFCLTFSLLSSPIHHGDDGNKWNVVGAAFRFEIQKFSFPTALKHIIDELQPVFDSGVDNATTMFGKTYWHLWRLTERLLRKSNQMLWFSDLYQSSIFIWKHFFFCASIDIIVSNRFASEIDIDINRQFQWVSFYKFSWF